MSTPTPPARKARGGYRIGAGRKPIRSIGLTTGFDCHMSIRLSMAQRETVDQLGGANWIRARIDEAAAALGQAKGRPQSKDQA